MHANKHLIPVQNKNHICADTPHRTYADIIQVYSSWVGCPETHIHIVRFFIIGLEFCLSIKDNA